MWTMPRLLIMARRTQSTRTQSTKTPRQSRPGPRMPPAASNENWRKLPKPLPRQSKTRERLASPMCKVPRLIDQFPKATSIYTKREIRAAQKMSPPARAKKKEVEPPMSRLTLPKIRQWPTSPMWTVPQLLIPARRNQPMRTRIKSRPGAKMKPPATSKEKRATPPKSIPRQSKTRWRFASSIWKVPQLIDQFQKATSTQTKR
mmetsp:Transcript_42409/g.117005  ORF Transcript_42409/g.117005 Transcript_42409/m.117005 type:complete len:203 (+) Transcript_42409:138-746(+)